MRLLPHMLQNPKVFHIVMNDKERQQILTVRYQDQLSFQLGDVFKSLLLHYYYIITLIDID